MKAWREQVARGTECNLAGTRLSCRQYCRLDSVLEHIRRNKLNLQSWSQRNTRNFVTLCVSLLLFFFLFASFHFNASIGCCVAADEAGDVDFCADYSAFAERFVRPPFPENADADEQKNWYALKKQCGRDLIKLSMREWPIFDVKPEGVDDKEWEKFIALEELSRFTIGELIFDENHGGTLIKKYYSTDYEPEKIIALSRGATEQVAKVKEAIASLTADAEWKALRNCALDEFSQDFERWFVPYCLVSLEKIPALDTFSENPDLFLSTADLLEFAVDYVPDNDKFQEVLQGVSKLLSEPKAKEIRVFHGRYEGFDLVSRDVIFQRYCDRIDKIEKKCADGVLRPRLTEGIFFNERQTERFEHGSLPQWGAKNPRQKDYFYVVFPKSGSGENKPLYVVLHSAGHSARTALECTVEKGNHDIYSVPDDFFGLFLDCYDNKATDWWWGGRRADQPEINEENASRATADLTPVEKRLLDEIDWVVNKYQIDPNRVYLCGNSMGGSGTLGLGLANGNVFAAVKANVPAGIWHAYDRLQLGEENAPTRVVDPPVCFDYSSPVDNWSEYHEVLFKGMEERKYSYVAYWGNFGHENNDEKVAKFNDLFRTFDWTSIRKDQAYPVFTNSSVDSEIPWPQRLPDSPAGQRGAFFRWENKTDSNDLFEIELRLATSEELGSKMFEVPKTSISDVSIRRIQNFSVNPNDVLSWEYGEKSGKVTADKDGLITIAELPVGVKPTVLKIFK